MFTSRAEYRLLLREDNADLRLTAKGRELGLVCDHRWATFEAKREAVTEEQQRLASVFVRGSALSADDRKVLGDDFKRDCSAADLLRRPELGYADIVQLSAVGAVDRAPEIDAEQDEQVVLQLEVQARYAGYIERQQREIDKHARQESLQLPTDIEYGEVAGLSNEARQRLEAARPETFGQASRLEGVTPATISLLLIHMKKRHLRQTA
jgi:tRNA uridine 5-carboxymethylaminomethyl modification enzyme